MGYFVYNNICKNYRALLFLIYKMMFLINKQIQTTKYDALAFVRATMLVNLNSFCYT
jgi:hypothetical protein